MKQSASNRKVNEQAREVIASILLFDVSDPRLHLVTITGCEVSYDRSVCNVYYTTDPERYAGAQAAFEAAAGHIRSLMAKKLSWRVAPELRFLLDTSVDQAERIASALERDAARNKKPVEVQSVAPELRFYVDTSVDQAEAISQALNSEREHQEKRIEEETIGEDREY